MSLTGPPRLPLLLRGELEPETITQATTLTSTEGVSWYVIAIGPGSGETCTSSHSQIATSIHQVTNLEDGNELVAPAINLT